MELKLKWSEHKTLKGQFIGECDALPDYLCNFWINEKSKQDYNVGLPFIGSTNLSLQFPFRDFEVAKLFCSDYLERNIREIVKHQIQDMNSRNYVSCQPVSYYNELLALLENATDVKAKKFG